MLKKLSVKAMLLPFKNFVPAWRLVQVEAKVRYRRSRLGIFWYVLSFVLKIAVLGAVYTKVLGKSPSEYLPFLVLGVSIWTFISGAIQGGCVVLRNNASFIYHDGDRFFFFIFKGVVRELFLALLLFVWSVLFVCMLIDVDLRQLAMSMGGLALVFVFVYLLSCLLSCICTLRPDVTHFISSMMNVFFIATPIIWDFSDAPDVQQVMAYNPFYYLIEVVRAPLLGRTLPEFSWVFFGVGSPVLLLSSSWLSTTVRKNFAKYV